VYAKNTAYKKEQIGHKYVVIHCVNSDAWSSAAPCGRGSLRSQAASADGILDTFCMGPIPKVCYF
ncbi:MAG: hypothetical protein KBB32_07525, partial [Spirochaetia bacterium]|nr:hypothetical protein [Spirochaetia bacterium]